MAIGKPTGCSEVSVPWDNAPAAARAEPSPLASVLGFAEEQGLMGPKDRQMSGRFPSALVEAAQRASGITEHTDLLT